MTFGSNPADIIVVLDFTRRLYRQCKNASDEYFEISREIRGLHTVLKHLRYEVEAPESVLRRDRALYARDLAPLVANCQVTLRELDELVRKYEGIREEERGASGPLWNQIKFGSMEMDQLGSIRMKLINHKTSITMLLDTIQLHESSRMAATLDTHGGQLDAILDKVDNIAARMGQRAGSLMTAYDNDDQEVWKSFRRELVAEGFSSDVLTQHKDALRAYIRQIDQNGLLDEMPPGPRSRQPLLSINTEEWLERLQSSASAGGPPSFDTLNSSSADSSIKELSAREENIKFPQSIKGERLRPESGALRRKEGIGDAPGLSGQLALRPMSSSNGNGSKSAMDGGPMAMVLKSSIPEPVICTTDAILADDYAHENQMRLLEAPKRDRRPRRASDQSERDYPNSPSRTSPVSARSSVSFTDGSPMTNRPPIQQLARSPEGSLYGTSPRASGLAIPSKPGTYAPSDRYGSSPRRISTSLSSTLAPDSQGRDIPRDAKWTKIRRSLISTEILEEDRLRYEARPEYVAILGIFSRDQIQDLAIRTAALRKARRARSQAARPGSRSTEQALPPPPPPPPKKAVRFNDHTEARGESTDESSDDRSANGRRRDRGHDRNRDRDGSYYNSPIAHNYSIASEGNGGRDRKGKERDAVPRGGGGRGGQKGGKWSERLTAASIGGAAASLLSVLSDAAADISI